MIGAIFGVAVLTVAARVATRVHTHRRLGLDDFFLLFGLASLSGATVLVIKYTRTIFLTEALYEDRGKYVFSMQDVLDVTNAIAIVDALAGLTWTTTFFVKFSFLALFRLLIRRVSKRITIYYWIVVVFTALLWALMVCEPFIFCPTFGFGTRMTPTIRSQIKLLIKLYSKMRPPPEYLLDSQYSIYSSRHHD